MTDTRTLTELAQELLHLHHLHYHQTGYVVGAFEMLPGSTESVLTEAYEELVAAGLMHRGRLAGYHDPGTFLLATAGLEPLSRH